MKAQVSAVVPTQVVAIGSEMTYRVDVENVSSNTTYHWSLVDKDGNVVKEEVLPNPQWVVLYSDSDPKIKPGEYKIVVYADNYNNECKSDEIDLKIEIIDSPIIKILTDNKNGFCSFSKNSEGPEEFVFEVGIEGYFGDWIVKYKVLDPSGNEVTIEGKTLHEVDIKKSKTEVISILLGDVFVNNADAEVFYRVQIEDVLLTGEHGTPTIVKDEDKGKFGIMPVVKIGTISTIKVE